VFAEWLDGGLFDGGRFDGSDDVARDNVFRRGPGPEGREGDVVIADGFLGEDAGRTWRDTVGGHAAASQIGEKAAHVVGFDGGDGHIADVVLEAMEDVDIVGDGAWRELARASVQQVAFDGL